MTQPVGWLTMLNHKLLAETGEATIYRDNPLERNGVVAVAVNPNLPSTAPVGRAAFEESVLQRYHDHPAPEYLLNRNGLDEYKNVGIQGEWVGWQTAMAFRVRAKGELRYSVFDLFARNTGTYIPTEQEKQEIEDGLDTLLTAAGELSDTQMDAMVQACHKHGLDARGTIQIVQMVQDLLDIGMDSDDHTMLNTQVQHLISHGHGSTYDISCIEIALRAVGLTKDMAAAAIGKWAEQGEVNGTAEQV